MTFSLIEVAGRELLLRDDDLGTRKGLHLCWVSHLTSLPIKSQVDGEISEEE